MNYNQSENFRYLPWLHMDLLKIQFLAKMYLLQVGHEAVLYTNSLLLAVVDGNSLRQKMELLHNKGVTHPIIFWNEKFGWFWTILKNFEIQFFVYWHENMTYSQKDRLDRIQHALLPTT